MNQKETIKVLLLAIIAVVAIAMSGYFICNKLNNRGPLIQFIEEGNSTFKSDEAGFELYYPDNIQLGNQLLITVNRIDSYPSTDAPLGFDQPNLLNHQKSLMEGGLDNGSIDWGGYQKLVKLPDNIFGEESYTFARFEVCNIVFEKRLIFFKNDYFISITLKADADSITQSNPQYFTEYSAEGCLGWKEGGMDDFYNNIDNNQDETVKQWLSDFDSIVNSISFFMTVDEYPAEPIDDPELEIIANNLFDSYLKPYLSEDKPIDERLKNYKIDSTSILYKKDNCFTFVVGFSVEPYTVAWTAGNGTTIENGWTINKSLYIDAIKIDNKYTIRQFIGTGNVVHECDKDYHDYGE